MHRPHHNTPTRHEKTSGERRQVKIVPDPPKSQYWPRSPSADRTGGPQSAVSAPLGPTAPYDSTAHSTPKPSLTRGATGHGRQTPDRRHFPSSQQTLV